MPVPDGYFFRPDSSTQLQYVTKYATGIVLHYGSVPTIKVITSPLYLRKVMNFYKTIRVRTMCHEIEATIYSKE